VAPGNTEIRAKVFEKRLEHRGTSSLGVNSNLQADPAQPLIANAILPPIPSGNLGTRDALELCALV
jgi:hypothetical protein